MGFTRMEISVAAVMLLGMITVFDVTTASTPSSKYVEITFDITWGEFCNLEAYFKKSLSNELLYPSNGAKVSTDKIVVFNFEDHCPPGKTSKELAAPKFFISKISGDTNPVNIDEEMTKKAYEVLSYYKEHGLERYLGTLFANKVKSVSGKGVMDPLKADDLTEIERLYIGLGIGLAVIILIVLVLVAIMCCRKMKNKDADDHGVEYKASNREVAAYHNPDESPRDNVAYNVDPQEPTVHIHKEPQREERESTQF